MWKLSVLTILVLAFGACSDNGSVENNESNPASDENPSEDRCGGEYDNPDEDSSTDEQEDSDRTMSSDSSVSTDETETDDEPKILSDAAYDSLMAAGIFVEEGSIFTTSYYEGYNLNFEITEEQASSLLPDNLAPKKIKLLQSDDEEKYYLSWYMAVIDAVDGSLNITRIDLFTYAELENGDLSLYFVSSYIAVPEAFRQDEAVFSVFKEMFEFFARDSKTGKPAYPHYYADSLEANRDTFKLVFGDSIIKMSACEPESVNERFTIDFILANSQIYRNAIDKNVNYFNQSFVTAKVEKRNIDCVEHTNLTGFHPMLENLRSVQFYGSKDKKITWFYQMCTADECGNPFK